MYEAAGNREYKWGASMAEFKDYVSPDRTGT